MKKCLVISRATTYIKFIRFIKLCNKSLVRDIRKIINLIVVSTMMYIGTVYIKFLCRVNNLLKGLLLCIKF